MLALVCVANPLFSASGSTLLLRLGPMAVYAESVAYGATMGAMLVAVLLWFEVGARLLPQDRLMSLLGGAMPTVTLMVSMTARLVPQLVRRAQTVRASEACIVAPGTQGSAVRGRTRLVGVLLGWSLENSLERADAMRARGWAASARRTSYRQHELGGSDVVALVALSVALLCCALLAGVACSQWRFYPTMPRLVAWWGYLPILAVALLPAILCAREAIAWRR
jgi:energy-coupling factor transport system permease protein